MSFAWIENGPVTVPIFRTGTYPSPGTRSRRGKAESIELQHRDFFAPSLSSGAKSCQHKSTCRFFAKQSNQIEVAGLGVHAQDHHKAFPLARAA
ncbi:hypothetical protein ACFQ3C_04475 [Seohaeicola saemankumensis]|uniref:Uncharacterized protein n=1 Tax=Seohaeicola saemankumensis TaxID=481181 RepID=A0ABW3TAF6_9RHOB